MGAHHIAIAPFRLRDGRVAMGLIARLSRIIPLIIVLAVVALVIYVAVSYMRSPERAKELLVRIFTVLSAIIIVFFGVVSLYALAESNSAVLDLALSFAAVGVVCLAITRWCNHLFLKHHPQYRPKATKAKTKWFQSKGKFRWPF